MAEDITLKEFFQVQFQSLEKKFDTGFSGIHQRQDVANGRVNKLEKWQQRLVGAWIMTSIILLPTGIFVLQLLFKK